ncbi:uncharacterized protein K444DRAFT_214598 [Hyaloscypha bicolor E]|uniref:Uncharacterized protein n=1 Tax=Hyaloscypha bicolor E TaxID=1095630 RepID=A0A2J6TQA4_9HELO|nr:uncharacterized protein K444DRAFT_214598 [Hyaloscypha bicolor E]PMD65138.1 hypothetical protein K444DRAFT_214598 [Hyaloscypha bicolor E]
MTVWTVSGLRGYPMRRNAIVLHISWLFLPVFLARTRAWSVSEVWPFPYAIGSFSAISARAQFPD